MGADHWTGKWLSSWWMFAILGIDFILLGILIIVFPELLAYLVAGFLLFNGLIFLMLAINIWRLRKSFRNYNGHRTIPVD